MNDYLELKITNAMHQKQRSSALEKSILLDIREVFMQHHFRN